MEEKHITYYNVNGLISKKSSDNIFSVTEHNNELFFTGDKIFYELDNICVDIRQEFRKCVFPDSEAYNRNLSCIPSWVYQSGLDSDSNMNCQYFNMAIQSLEKQKDATIDICKHLFLADCFSVVDNLQDRFLSTQNQFVNFYKLFCESPIIIIPKKNGIFWTNSIGTRSIFSVLNDLIISLYAILDLTTKLIFQLENMPTDFSKWHKLSSKTILFGDKKRLKLDNTDNTIYEKNCSTVNIILSLRHEIIHNGSWEPLPKLFYQIEKGKISERWIYMPDFNTNGNLLKVRNRNRFFSFSKKINNELPDLCFNFWERALKTLEPMSQ